MAVMLVMDWEGVTPEQYDQAKELVNWEGDPAPGGIYHASGFDEAGLHVVDIWESAEDFQRFVGERLTPGVQQLGIAGQPEVRIYPIHDLFAPGYPARG